MARTTFSGPVRTGRDTGVPGTTTIGTLVATQMTTVADATSGASSIVLPQDAGIKGMSVIVVTPATTTNTQGMLIRVGTTTDAVYYANIKVSAAGVYYVGVAPNVAAASAANWKNVSTSGPQRLYIDVTAATTAGETGGFEGLVYIDYFQRP